MHVLRVVREILYFKPQHRGTRLQTALEYLNRVLTRTAVIFLISDFMDQGFEKALKIISRRHDLIAIHLWDPTERSFPAAGLIEMEDAETSQKGLMDTSTLAFQKNFQSNGQKREENLDRLFKSLGIDRVTINTSQSHVEPLMRFFKAREKRI